MFSHSRPNLLIIANSLDNARFLAEILASDFQPATTLEAVEQALKAQRWDLILCDTAISLIHPHKLLKRILSIQPQSSVILIGDAFTLSEAIDLMRLGARAVVEKQDHARLAALASEELEARCGLRYEHYLKGIVDTMLDSVLAISLPDHKIIYVNDAFERIFGYPATNFVDDPGFFRQVVHPDDLAIAEEAQRTCMRDGLVEFEHRIILPDGQARWLQRRGQMTYDGLGRPFLLTDNARDITAFKQAEAKYITAFQANPTIAGLSDIETGKYLEVNRAFCERLGYTLDEVIGRASTDVVRLDAPSRTRIVEKLRKQGHVEGEEAVIYAKDGTPIPVLLYAEVVTVHGKQYNFTAAVDITERKKAEGALYQSEKRLRSILQNMQDVVWSANLLDSQITYMNPPTQAFYGRPETDFYSDNALWSKMIHPDDAFRIQDLHHLLLQEGRRDEEYRIIRPNGEVRWVRDRAWLVNDEQGRPVSMEGIASDITRLKQVETELRASEARQKAIFANLPDLMILIRADGTILNVHGAVPRDLSPLEALIGHNIREFFASPLADPPVIQGTLNNLAQVMSTRQVMSFEYTMPDSHEYEARFAPVGDTDEIIILVRNITERKQAARILRASEERYRSLIESSDADITMIDADGRFLYMNEIAARNLGVSPEMLVAKPIREAFSDADAGKILHNVKHVIATSNGLILEEEVVIAGQKRWYRTSVQPVKDGSGKTYAALIHASEITEKKRTEQAILVQNEILQQSHDLIGLAELNGKITFINQDGAKMLGAEGTEMCIGTYLTRYMPLEDAARALEEYIPQAMETGYWRGENHLKTLDGRLVDVDQTIFPIRDNTGKITQMATIMSDITDRKRVQNALRESEMRLRLFIKHAPAAIAMFDKDMRYLAVSSRYLADYRLTDESLVGRIHYDVFPEIPLRWKDIHQRCLNGAVEKCDADPFPRADGTVDWVRWEIRPWRDAHGEIGGVLLFSELITEGIQAQQAVRASEERYRSLIESSDAVVSMFDENGTILFANAIAAQSLGCTPEQMIGQNMKVLFPPASADRQLGEIRKVIQTGVGVVNEAISMVAGETRWYRTSVQPVRNATGTIYAALINASDITRFKAAELALRQSDQQFQQFMRHLPGAVFIIDADDTLIYCNDQYARMMGKTPDEIIGKRGHDYIPAAVVDDYVAENRQVLTENRAVEFNHMHPQLGESSQWLTVKFPIAREDQPPLIGAVSLDVTKEKLAEALLQEANAMLEQRVALRTAELEKIKNRIEAIFNHSGDGIVLLDLHNGILQANYAFDEMFLKRENAYLGADLSTILAPEEVEKLRTVIHEVAQTHQMQRVEAQARRENGESFDVEINIAPINRSEKAITNLVCIIRDVTARRRAESALRESEERYRLLAENVTDMITQHTDTGIFTYVSPSALSMTGYSPEELIGRTAYELMHPDDASQILTSSSGLESPPKDYTVAYRLRRKDGLYTWLETTSHLIFHPETGALISVVAVSRDISARKQAEQALRESEERFRQFLESAPIATVIVDQGGKITLVNREAELMYGYTRQELIGQYIEILVPDGLRGVHIHHRNEDLSSILHRRKEPVELIGQRKDGSTFPVEIQVRLVNSTPTPVVMCLIVDITVRAQAEATLKQALAHEKELGDLKSRFVSMASHEFRTPLAAILATTETLTFYRERLDKTQIDGRLDRIRQQVNHMKSIMEDVLQLARIQAGRVEFKPASGNLSALCQEIVEEFDGQAQYQGRIAYACVNTPITSEYDSRLMRQVISNLVSNALKYSENEKRIYVTLAFDSAQVQLEVRDEGIGIPQEDMKRLFEPFHRASNVGTISGTGLGLSITKQAVDLHKGTITTASQIGVGTRISVIFPVLDGKGLLDRAKPTE